MFNNYFFFDGSGLIADIKRLRQAKGEFVGRRLDLKKLGKFFVTQSGQFTDGSFRRVVFYFANGDPRVGRDCLIPDFEKPNNIKDLSIRYCGKRVDKKAADDWLAENSAPQWVCDRLRRSEKAVDTQMCCDAMQLAALGKIDRLFLYANDFDFAPLLITLKALGVNANLLQLTAESPNASLVELADGFTVVGERCNEVFEAAVVNSEGRG